eukprot:5982218-Pleurochrysis_carterae.AAC.2
MDWDACDNQRERCTHTLLEVNADTDADGKDGDTGHPDGCMQEAAQSICTHADRSKRCKPTPLITMGIRV